MVKYLINKNSILHLQNSKKNEFINSINSNGIKSNFILDIFPKGYLVNKTKLKNTKTKVLSFFSGAGGLDIGAQLAGAEVLSSLDFDKDSIQTLKSNNYFSKAEHLCEDIRNISAINYKRILKEKNPEKLILIGGPPCQPFSKAGYWVTHKKRLGNKDPRNMISEYLRLVSEIKPDGFVLENVESILHPKNINTVNILEELIYKLNYQFIRFKDDAINYGVPQKRKRVFFIATKRKLKFLPKRTHGYDYDDTKLLNYERVIDWIYKFDDIKYEEREEKTLNKTYDKELKEIPPGENYFALTKRENYPKPKFEANKRFWSFLLKLHPLLPSWTIPAQPGPWVGPFHWNNRRLRVNEIAAIQTFPSDYKFFGTRRSVQKQIGNAVPPLMARSVIEYLLKQI